MNMWNICEHVDSNTFLCRGRFCAYLHPSLALVNFLSIDKSSELKANLGNVSQGLLQQKTVLGRFGLSDRVIWMHMQHTSLTVLLGEAVSFSQSVPLACTFYRYT